jgi:hypothetical protein
MRTVELSRQIDASPPVVDRALGPADVIAYEGSFEVFEIEERADDWLVVAGASGLRLTLRFEQRDHGVFYEQEQAEGQPLETMQTTITYGAADHGTTVTATSEVRRGLPPTALSDRRAAWKRKGELDRALDSLAEAVE